MIKLDDWWDIAIAGVIILCTIGMLLAFFKRGGNIKAGKEGVAVSGGVADGASMNLSEMAVTVTRIDAGLKAINETLGIMLKSLSAIDQIQGPQIRSQKITLKFIKRELGREDHDDPINGDLDEAMAEINEANQHYKDMRNVWGKP